MKKILLLFYCFCTIYGLQAQTPIINWEYAIGDNGGVEQIKTSAYDEGGNLYVAGHFYGIVDLDHGTGSYLLTASGGYDAFVAKYNSFGEILWAMRMGGTLSESVNHLSVANGYVLLTGFFQGTMTVFAPNITFPLTSVSSSADIFMARLGTDGLIYGSPYKIGMGGNDEGKCIKSDLDGNIYLSGLFSSPNNNTNVNFNVTGGTNNLLAAGSEDGFIVKYNSDFILQWVKKYGGSSFNDAVITMDIDNNKNVYAAGFFNGTNATFNNNIFLTSVGGADAFISKIEPSGNTLWAKRIGGGNGDVITTIKLNGKGVIYAGGNFNGLANLNPNGTAQNFTAVGGDAFISKLDTNQATALWIKQFGGSGLDNLYGLDLDTLGNVYTTGSFIGSAEFPIGISASALNSGSWKDIFVSKLNTNGVFVWSKAFGTVLEDDGYSIAVTANGNTAYVTGSSPTFGHGYMAKIGNCAELKPISGLIKLCSNTQRVYSVDTVFGATSYVWTLPSGWVGTSNTRTITVTPSTNSGNITVNAITACGAGFSRSLSINYGTTNLDNNLVRYWLANENDNNKDIKNNFGLTLVNTVKDTAMHGTVNGAYRISNNAGFIQLQPNANLPTGATSISLWYYYQSNGGSNNVILGSNGTALPASHPILLTDNASSKLYPWSSAGAPIGTGVTIAQNTWHHIVLTRNGSNFTFYVNGVLAYSGNNLSTSNFDRIGNNRPGVETQGATGKFDDIKIYNAIITEAQVKSLYEFGSIKSTSLLASGCKNKTISFQALSSNSNATYAWKLNGTTVGSNLPTFVKTPAFTDSVISVTVNSQCFEETISKSFKINSADSVRIISTDCGIKIGNKTYAASGNYIDTLVNQFGCDSIVYLNLTVSNSQFTNLSSNLIRYWTLNAQDSAKDLTNNFVLNKTAGIVYSNDRFGNSNSALFVPAASAQEMLPAVTLPNNNITISFWYHYATTGITGVGVRGLLTNTSSLIDAGYYLYIDINGNLMVNNNAGVATTVPGQLIANNWYYLTFSLSNTGVAKVYVNGELKLSNNNMSLVGIVKIGRGPGNTYSPGVGSYDDIKVYNTVISDADIAKIYDRPSIISRPFLNKFCQNNKANFAYKVSSSNNSSYQFLKNNTNVSNDTFYVANNLAATDTLVTFKVFSKCGFEEFKTRLNVQPTSLLIQDSFCGSYVYNNKTYTNVGTYYDTIANLNGCVVSVQLNLTSKAGVNLSSNLTHHFTLNNTENTNLVNSLSGITISATAPSVSGRSNNANTGRAISAVGQNMQIASLLNSNITVSLWYQRTTSSYTGARTIIANTQTNGNIAKMVYTSSTGAVFLGNSTTTAGVPTGFTLNTSVWYHIVYQVASNGDAKLYINGNLVSSITGLPLNTIALIGNRNDGNEPGIGNYDDIKVHNKILSADEISKLYFMPSLIARPAFIEVCEGSSALITYHFSGNTGTTYQFKKNGVTLSTDSFLLRNNTNLNDTLFEFTIKNTCGFQTYTVKVSVAPAGGVGQSLAYSKITSRITATSSFTRYKLFRNGVLIDSSNTTGKINFSTTLCGNYVAHYSNTGSANCPAISPVLKINLDTVTLNTKICAGKTYAFGSQQLSTAGTYHRTTTSVNGCDSIIKLNLTLANASTASINRVGCGSLVIYGKTYTQTGQYKDTLINAAGCDSIVTLNLTINSGGPAINNIVQSTCNNFVLNGKTYTNTGIYHDTLIGASATGCDSILVLNLTNLKNGSVQNIAACKNYVIKGVTITQSGTYRDTLTNMAGCDSIVVYNLNINTVNKTVTKIGNTLTAAATNANYLWINCTTNLPIANANMQSYTPTASGSYKVIITQNGCVDTSACTNVTIINCNLQLTHSVLNPTDTIRCKQVKVNITNGTLPIDLKLTWSTNIIGLSLNITDSTYTFNDACPETYKLVATDNNGCKDSIGFTINEPTIGVSDINVNSFSMYPNPANKILIINNLNKESQINIFDITGRIIYAENILTSNTELNIENWKDGIYTVQVITEGRIANQKLIIAK
ncbi:MAG: LamG-like jellyroll fold domain-containing protein [Bacteroidia bacterium]